MTTSTIAPEQRRNILFTRNLGPATRTFEAKSTKGEGTSLMIEGKPIFRSGSFADSEGYEHEWADMHLQQMQMHFGLLSGNAIFEDVPIRKGHPDRGGLFGGSARNTMDELVGYITAVNIEERVNPSDGQSYTYFLADLEIIDEDAKKNIQSGLWRNMSAEIGAFVTNSNAEYWPVMMGVAYVDIPAVEGLKVHAKASQQYSLILEEGMTQSSLPGNPNPPVPGDTTDHGKGGTPAAPFMFSIAGQTTTDFAAVQNHITAIETENTSLRAFRKESEESARVNYVSSLVSGNKILEPQREAYVAYAQSLDPTAFAAWKGLMDVTVPHTIAGPQAAGFSMSVQTSSEGDVAKARVNDLKAMISTHSMNQVPVDTIKTMASYKELIGLEPSYTIPA